jgi:hypothetical protein
MSLEGGIHRLCGQNLGKVCTTRFRGTDLTFCHLGRISHKCLLPSRFSGSLSVATFVAETRELNLRAIQAFRKALRAIHRLPRANSVVIWAVFFINPRYRVFV